MPRPDSSAIDAALSALLAADSELLATMPDGVWIDEAPANLRRFVIVSLVDSHDVATFGRGRTIEDATYLVKAVALSSSGADIKAAAARIDALLEDGTLTVPGYGLMAMYRTDRIRSIEVDEVDPSIRWQHRGGRYRVMVALT